MSRAPGGMREIVPHTRRERVNNYGDAVDVVGPGRVTIFDHTGELGSSLTLTVQCLTLFVPGGAPAGDYRPYVHVEWGHGGSSAEADVDVTYRQRFPVCASSLKVQAYIASVPLPATPATPGEAVPFGVVAKFQAFISEGTDALPLFATRWVAQVGLATGVVTTGPARLARARCTSVAAAGNYFQLFDQVAAPAGGNVPFDVAAIDVSGNGLIDEGETRGFVQGLTWGISSTPFVYTAVAHDVAAFFELEQ
jgi:hypothetical protein